MKLMSRGMTDMSACTRFCQEQERKTRNKTQETKRQEINPLSVVSGFVERGKREKR